MAFNRDQFCLLFSLTTCPYDIVVGNTCELFANDIKLYRISSLTIIKSTVAVHSVEWMTMQPVSRYTQVK